ncbi:hypothetical protein NMY22_g1972 [Coprinellus aureogranulatus]|nr:hypothetical protein NMY22_g1972 [Coprinellus aureogranulatus]
MSAIGAKRRVATRLIYPILDDSASVRISNHHHQLHRPQPQQTTNARQPDSVVTIGKRATSTKSAHHPSIRRTPVCLIHPAFTINAPSSSPALRAPSPSTSASPKHTIQPPPRAPRPTPTFRERQKRSSPLERATGRTKVGGVAMGGFRKGETGMQNDSIRDGASKLERASAGAAQAGTAPPAHAVEIYRRRIAVEGNGLVPDPPTSLVSNVCSQDSTDAADKSPKPPPNSIAFVTSGMPNVLAASSPPVSLLRLRERRPEL